MGPTYVGFCIDWSIQVIGLICYFIILFASGSMFFGFCLYITAMVADIKIRVMALDTNWSGQTKAADRIRMRTVYVREAQFHMEILEYVPQIGVCVCLHGR